MAVDQAIGLGSGAGGRMLPPVTDTAAGCATDERLATVLALFIPG